MKQFYAHPVVHGTVTVLGWLLLLGLMLALVPFLIPYGIYKGLVAGW